MNSFFDRLSYTDVAKAIDHSLLKPQLDDENRKLDRQRASRPMGQGSEHGQAQARLVDHDCLSGGSGAVKISPHAEHRSFCSS